MEVLLPLLPAPLVEPFVVPEPLVEFISPFLLFDFLELLDFFESVEFMVEESLPVELLLPAAPCVVD